MKQKYTFFVLIFAFEEMHLVGVFFTNVFMTKSIYMPLCT